MDFVLSLSSRPVVDFTELPKVGQHDAVLGGMRVMGGTLPMTLKRVGPVTGMLDQFCLV